MSHIKSASMNYGFISLTVLLFTLGSLACTQAEKHAGNLNAARPTDRGTTVKIYNTKTKETRAMEKIIKSDDEWRKLLTEEQFRIARKAGTERAFTGEYWDTHDKGIYECRCCGTDLFSSETKFNSGTGWPSFWAPVSDSNIELKTDRTLGDVRNEALCARCGAHLGHVFDDGPKPTGLRYCMNSASLKLNRTK